MTSFAARVPFANGISKRSSWDDLRDGRDPPAHAHDRAFAHVKDLIAQAQPVFDPSTPLPKYLEQAERSLAASKTSLSLGRVDIAFREYLKASEILLNTIPRHKDYGFFEGNQPKWAHSVKLARSGVNDMASQMMAVRKIIEDNNTRHNTVQRSTTSGENAVALPSAPRLPSTVDLPDVLKVRQPKPTSVSKPDHLRSPSVPMATNLQTRFASLRMGTSSPPAPGSMLMPEYTSFQAAGTGLSSRPSGPRDMPSVMPPIPNKGPFLQDDMPKAPDRTFSAAQSARTSRDVHRPPTEKKQTYYGQPIANLPNPQLQRYREEQPQPYRPHTPNGVNLAIVSKSDSSEIPSSHMVDAETLYTYLRKYNVLLVDVRDRNQFDEGHILATSIMCVEPLALKEGVSAEMLEERLVLSPDNEQILFSRRNEFDLVIYYDQNQSDIDYLGGSPTTTRAPHLRAIYDTLWEFNEYKPLKDGRRPALLQGGLDAWVDLMGAHSLATSKTAAMLGTTRQRPTPTPGRTLGRQRLVSTNSRFEVRDRRLRNHKFLDETEQKAWRQQAEQEQVAAEHDLHLSDVDSFEEEPEPQTPFIPDYESFLRRFPSVSNEQQSMVMPMRKPVVPPKRYDAPTLPTMPSRPTPAVPRPSYTGQADIIQASAPLARVTSSTRQPLYSSASRMLSRRLPRTGLTNFGVTCYMNATLQCLSATIPLANFFLDEYAFRQNLQKNWKGSSGIMPEIFSTVVRSLWKGDVEMIKPTTFRNFCGRMNKEWVIDRQQDAKEFFDFLVDCLHEDLNIAWQRTPLKPLTTEQELQRERYRITDAAPIEWDRYQHRDRSFISSLFAGQHASRLKCLTCRSTSTTYEAFYSISIEIPRSGAGDIDRCLESYTQEERLDPDERWKCPTCKCERDATKQIILTRLPQFLVIHFKRFSAGHSDGGGTRKVHTPIDFPLVGLNMDRYVCSPPGQQVNTTVDSDSTSSGPDVATLPPFSYDCYGVLRHLGSSGDGGHYISLVKDQGRNCWRKFDDTRHYDFDPTQLGSRDKLQNGEAYILFFQRVMPK